LSSVFGLELLIVGSFLLLSVLFSNNDLVLGDNNPMLRERHPRRASEVMEDLENVHLVEDPPDLLHVGSAMFEHVGVLDSKVGKFSLVSDDSCCSNLSLSNMNPLIFEASPRRGGVVMEDLEDVHLVEDELDSPHVSATMFELVDIFDSESFEASLVSNDSLGSHVVDLRLSDLDPIMFEGGPGRGSIVVEYLEDVHLVEDVFDSLHIGTTGLKLVGVLDLELLHRAFVENHFSVLLVSDLVLGDVDPVVVERSPRRLGVVVEDLE
jgi:hypothetical protein